MIRRLTCLVFGSRDIFVYTSSLHSKIRSIYKCYTPKLVLANGCNIDEDRQSLIFRGDQTMTIQANTTLNGDVKAPERHQPLKTELFDQNASFIVSLA